MRRPEDEARAAGRAATPSASGVEPPRTRRPWWGWLFFFLPPPPEARPEHWRLLGLIGATFLLNQYDMALLGLALPQIQAEFAVPEERLGQLVGWVRLGLLPAFGLALLADRLGRRRMLLATIAGFAVCTGATALSRDATQFITLQLLARAFITAEEMVAIVIIAEELPSRARGWGFGILAALGALGHGAASLAFGFVEALPFGWRALYVVGVLPIALLAWLRRTLRETARFQAAAAVWDGGSGLARLLDPLRDAWRRYPARLAVFVAAVIPFGAILTMLSFASKILQDEHAWEPYQVTQLFIGGGALAIFGYAVGGRLADRWGRRRTLAGSLVLAVAAGTVFGTGSGPILVPAWILMMFGFMASDVLWGGLSVELFPTSYRATTSGLRSLAAMVGAIAGLWLEGWLYPLAGGHGVAAAWMLPASLVSVVIVVFFLPETAARPLEDIAPDAAEPQPGDPTWSTRD